MLESSQPPFPEFAPLLQPYFGQDELSRIFKLQTRCADIVAVRYATVARNAKALQTLDSNRRGQSPLWELVANSRPTKFLYEEERASQLVGCSLFPSVLCQLNVLMVTFWLLPGPSFSYA